MPILVVRGPDGKEREVTLSGGETSIGRAEGCDLVLAEGGVSRTHAKVTVKGETVVIEDTGSANGTYIEGQRIGAPTIVPPGKILQIGDYELRVKAGGGPSLAIVKSPRPKTGSMGARGGAAPRLGDAPAPSTRTLPKRVGSGPPAVDGKRDPLARPAARPARPPGPRVVRDVPEGPALVGVSGLWTNKRWAVEGKIVVGRLPGVDIQLDDDSVSRRHAELELTPRGVRLKDLNSANGTAVNGMPVEGTITLQSGDVIQFGVVELQFENDAEESAGGSSAANPRRRRLVVVATLCLMVVGGAVAAKLLLPKPGGAGGAAQPGLVDQFMVAFGLGPKEPIKGPDPQAAIQELLAACRSYVRPEQGEPDWVKADAACHKVLDLEPIQEEATALLRQIKAEQEAKIHAEKADNLSLRLHNEEALIEYGAIPATSFYYLRVKPKIAEAVDKALEKSWADCNLYVRQRDYKSALARCEAWLKLACQDMDKDDVTPPAGYAIRTGLPKHAKLKDREWMPSNPKVLVFYQVREKVDPTLGPWKCERMEILARGIQEESPEKAVRRLVAKAYPDRTFAGIVMDYWLGKNEQAVQALQKIRQDLRKTEMHATAEQLALDMNAVASLYKTGQTLIQGDEVEKAAERYKEALATDQKLMGESAEKYPSWFRDAMLRDVADATLKTGRVWMQRNDRKSACKYWRLGFGFYRGNVELNRAVSNQCSSKANELLGGAQSCADLEQVLLYAIDGDEVKERVGERKQQWACP
ncbi:MAG TPA: FHA domain-containing protein [Myxococcales bacterium]|nr:FHA domain-containing protein [Myxococcales bacterium]